MFTGAHSTLLIYRNNYHVIRPGRSFYSTCELNLIKRWPFESLVYIPPLMQLTSTHRVYTIQCQPLLCQEYFCPYSDVRLLKVALLAFEKYTLSFFFNISCMKINSCKILYTYNSLYCSIYICFVWNKERSGNYIEERCMSNSYCIVSYVKYGWRMVVVVLSLNKKNGI